MDDLTMWRERAEAAEAEVATLHRTGVPREIADACEVYSLAVRLVALSALYSDAAVNRAICMMRDHAHASDEDAPAWTERSEDAAALFNIIRVVERRANPEAWHASLAADEAPRASLSGERQGVSR